MIIICLYWGIYRVLKWVFQYITLIKVCNTVMVLNWLLIVQGLEKSWETHRKCAEMLWEGVEKLGLELLVQDKVCKSYRVSEWRNWDSSYWFTSKTRYLHHTERGEKLGLDLLVQDEVRNLYKEGYYGNKPLDEEKNNGEKIWTYNNVSYLHVHTV